MEPDGAGEEKDVQNEGTVADAIRQWFPTGWWGVLGKTMESLCIGAASAMVFLCE